MNQISTPTDQNLITNIQELRATTVPKSEYERVKQEAERYKIALLNGTNDQAQKNELSVNEAKKNYMNSINNNVNNLEGFKNALILREAVIREKGIDLFEANDSRSGFGEDVANYIQNAIDRSENNSSVFTAVFGSNIKQERKRI